jgi:hypothetical protein
LVILWIIIIYVCMYLDFDGNFYADVIKCRSNFGKYFLVITIQVRLG